MTCYHVVSGQTRLQIRDQSGTFHPATILARDIANDIAILKIRGTAFPYIPVRRSTDVRKGDEIFVLGYPNISMQGLDSKVTQGIISSTQGFAGEPNSFQISAAIQPGNSGGPLVDRHGNVIGIVNAKLGLAAALRTSGALPENVNYAIKSNYLVKLLKSQRGIAFRLAVQSPTISALHCGSCRDCRPRNRTGHRATAPLIRNQVHPGARRMPPLASPL